MTRYESARRCRGACYPTRPRNPAGSLPTALRTPLRQFRSLGWQRHPIHGIRRIPPVRVSGLIAARRKEGLEGMPLRRHYGPPLGVASEPAHPEGLQGTCVCRRRGRGSQPRHRPHGSSVSDLVVGLTPPSGDTPNPLVSGPFLPAMNRPEGASLLHSWCTG